MNSLLAGRYDFSGRKSLPKPGRHVSAALKMLLISLFSAACGWAKHWYAIVFSGYANLNFAGSDALIPLLRNPDIPIVGATLTGKWCVNSLKSADWISAKQLKSDN
jgi:hypothetical protein